MTISAQRMQDIMVAAITGKRIRLDTEEEQGFHAAVKETQKETEKDGVILEYDMEWPEFDANENDPYPIVQAHKS